MKTTETSTKVTEKKAINKTDIKREIIDNLKVLYRKNLDNATPYEVYFAVALAVKDIIVDKWIATHKEYEKQDVKTVYYLSMEFLMGRALGNEMLNICCEKGIKEALDELGF